MLNMAAVQVLCLQGNKKIEPRLIVIGGKVLHSREMDFKFNLEWKLIPLPCACTSLSCMKGGGDGQYRDE